MVFFVGSGGCFGLSVYGRRGVCLGRLLGSVDCFYGVYGCVWSRDGVLRRRIEFVRVGR